MYPGVGKAWSEHIHQGFYGINGDEKKDHRQAQDDLIEAMLKLPKLKFQQTIHSVY